MQRGGLLHLAEWLQLHVALRVELRFGCALHRLLTRLTLGWLPHFHLRCGRQHEQR